MSSDPVSNPRRVRRVRFSIFALVLVAFGLLLWARFLLVTGHPRTAIAEPQGQPQVVGAQEQSPESRNK